MRKRTNEELDRLSPEAFKKADKIPVCMVLDNVRSMHNVGSVFRTSDAFRVEKIYLCGITGTPPHREIHRSALGAEDSVAWEHVSDTIELTERLKHEGFTIAAIEQADGSLSLEKFKPAVGMKYAFVFGNELEGVTGQVVENADICIEIPQFGSKHSFNIAVSASIVLWHFHITSVQSIG